MTYFQIIASSSIGCFIGCEIHRHLSPIYTRFFQNRIRASVAKKFQTLVSEIEDEGHRAKAHAALKSAFERNHVGDLKEITEKISKYLKEQKGKPDVNQHSG